jgi:hypothetical protein
LSAQADQGAGAIATTNPFSIETLDNTTRGRYFTLLVAQRLIKSADRLVEFPAQTRGALVGAFLREFANTTSTAGTRGPAAGTTAATAAATTTGFGGRRGFTLTLAGCFAAAQAFAFATHATDPTRQCACVTAFALTFGPVSVSEGIFLSAATRATFAATIGATTGLTSATVRAAATLARWRRNCTDITCAATLRATV